MAKVVSHLHSSMRGSIAGVTYLTTPSGQIIARQRTNPVNPSSTFQGLVRSAFSASVTQWEQLTEKLRQYWDAWAQSAEGTGRQNFVAGHALLQYMIARNLLSPVPLLEEDAPTVGSVPIIIPTVVVYTVPPADPRVKISIENLQPVRTAVLCEISPGLRNTRNFWKGPWATMESKGAVLAASVTGTVEFTNLVEGTTYMVRLRPVYAPAPLDLFKGQVVGKAVQIRTVSTKLV